jgi:hypothetical protein
MRSGQHLFDLTQDKVAQWRVQRVEIAVKVATVWVALILWQSFGSALAFQLYLVLNSLVFSKTWPALISGTPGTMPPDLLFQTVMTWWGWRTISLPALLLGWCWALLENHHKRLREASALALSIGLISSVIFMVPHALQGFLSLSSPARPPLTTTHKLIHISTEWIADGALVGSLMLLGSGFLLRWRYLHQHLQELEKPPRKAVFVRSSLNQFSQETRRIITRAEVKALKEGYLWVGPEHLGFALLQDKIMKQVLMELDVPIEQINHQLRLAIEPQRNGEASQTKNQQGRLTAQSKKAIELALLHAKSENPNSVVVQPRHLFIALLSLEDEIVLHRILQDLSIDKKELKNRL